MAATEPPPVHHGIRRGLGEDVGDTYAAGMSQREAEVLDALGATCRMRRSRRLHISVRTVETHVSSLLRKLGVADRRALAALAPECGDL